MAHSDKLSMDGDGWVAEVHPNPDDTPPSIQLTINNGANSFSLTIRQEEIPGFIYLLQLSSSLI